jgi:hypothetical protein
VPSNVAFFRKKNYVPCRCPAFTTLIFRVMAVDLDVSRNNDYRRRNFLRVREKFYTLVADLLRQILGRETCYLVRQYCYILPHSRLSMNSLIDPTLYYVRTARDLDYWPKHMADQSDA